MNVNELSGFFFLDTNILVYSFDNTTPAKQLMAANCTTLLSEDLHHGQVIRGLTILNPFTNR